MSKGLEILFPYVLLNLFVFQSTKNVLCPNTRDNKSFQQIVWAKARLDKNATNCEINLIGIFT